MSEPVSKVSFFRPIGGARPVVSREAVLHAAYAVLTGTAYTDFTFARVAQVAGADESELHRWWDTPGELAVDTFFALLDLQDSECAQTDFRIQTHGLASQLRGPMGKALPSCWRRVGRARRSQSRCASGGSIRGATGQETGWRAPPKTTSCASGWTREPRWR